VESKVGKKRYEKEENLALDNKKIKGKGKDSKVNNEEPTS